MLQSWDIFSYKWGGQGSLRSKVTFEVEGTKSRPEVKDRQGDWAG